MFMKRLFRGIRTNILVGFFLTIPVVTTIIIFRFLLKLATDWPPQSWFPDWLREAGKGYPLRALILILIAVALYLIGLLTRNFLGRRLYGLGEKILINMPLVKGIYLPVRQISESLFTQRKTLFKEVVLVQYPRKGLYSMAFVTAEVPANVAEDMGKKKEPCVSLFIPTTPNPTSGLLILVPRSETIPLSMPVADALTFIMSAGAVRPGRPDDLRPTLLDKLESWLKHDGDSETGEDDVATPTNP